MLNRRSLVPAGIVAFVAGVVLFFESFTAAQAPAKAERVVWEYSVYQQDPGEPDRQTLNKLGSEGWELVSVEPAIPYVRNNSDVQRISRIYTFKRPK